MPKFIDGKIYGKFITKFTNAGRKDLQKISTPPVAITGSNTSSNFVPVRSLRQGGKPPFPSRTQWSLRVAAGCVGGMELEHDYDYDNDVDVSRDLETEESFV